MPTAPHAADTRRPIVLVHGAWGGAWIWRRVLAPLRAAGHAVHAVTLTGVGDRAHLAGAAVNLTTHVTDVVAAVQAEELRGITLVGHSYGGMVVTGATDRLEAARAGTVARLVYVDAVVPRPGEAWNSTHAAATRAERTALAAAHGGLLPPPPASAFGLEAADAAWVERRSTPHPFGCYAEALAFDEGRWSALPRTFIDCTAPALATIDESRRRVRAQTGWVVHELATGHCPQVSAPHALVELLLRDEAGVGG